MSWKSSVSYAASYGIDDKGSIPIIVVSHLLLFVPSANIHENNKELNF